MVDKRNAVRSTLAAAAAATADNVLRTVCRLASSLGRLLLFAVRRFGLKLVPCQLSEFINILLARCAPHISPALSIYPAGVCHRLTFFPLKLETTRISSSDGNRRNKRMKDERRGVGGCECGAASRQGKGESEPALLSV